jgi:NAD(P)-dependent dehydrogenase (short-subunit alcohol dehydrogenase family)
VKSKVALITGASSGIGAATAAAAKACRTYDLPTDRDELRGESVSMEHLTGACRRVGMTSAAIESAAARVRAWRHCINYGKVLRRAA